MPPGSSPARRTAPSRSQADSMAIEDQVERLRQGAEVWNNWRAANPEVVLDLSGAKFHGAKLAGVNITGTGVVENKPAESNLQGIDLSDADLTGAHLGDVDLTGANLVGADLTKATIITANLSKSLLVGAKLNEAIFGGVKFTNANLMLSDLSNAKLWGDAAAPVDLTGADFRSANLTDVQLVNVRWVRSKMLGKYQGIRGIESTHGNALFKRDATDQDYIDTLRFHWRGSWRMLLWLFWGLLTDFGRSLSRIAVMGIVLIIIYGSVYSHWSGMLRYPGTSTWFTPFYFSIATYTTIGFGDVVPATVAGEIVVSTEVILGYLTLGLILAVLADKVARRS
jgi:uncharacterized protein YjbI with pentapeptide repeats